MPTAALSPCAEPGCPTLVSKGRCATHTRAKDMARGTRHARGYDSRWTRYSQRFRREYPLCGWAPPAAPNTRDSVCQQEGRVSPADVVDHIIPVMGATDPRFYDESNHQSLCHRCHNSKRQREWRT